MIKKSILAIAIASASTAAMAAGEDRTILFSPDSSQIEIEGLAFNNLTIGGSTDISYDHDDNDALNINGVRVDGNLVFNGSIKANGQYADGIDLDRAFDGQGQGTEVAGKLINSGSIVVNGFGSTAVKTDSAVIRGGFENSGTISAIGADEFAVEAGGVAVEFSNSIIGGFTNSGVINASGYNSKGLSSTPNDNDPMTGAGINGDIVNSGTIRVIGVDSEAISLTDTTVKGRLVNSGTISMEGDYSDALDIDRGTLTGIVNSGIIQALGIDVSAILLDSANVTEGIYNTGTITSTGSAIVLEGNLPSTTITQAGGVISGQKFAIDGGNAGNLNWTGGQIIGNVIRLNNVTLDGKGLVFGGRAIQAAQIDLKSGDLTLLGDHTTFQGDLTMGQGTTLNMLLDDSTSVEQAVLRVSGKVIVNGDSKIALAARSKDFSATGTEYTLLSAEGGLVNGQNLTVASTSQLLNVDSYSAANNTVKAVVTTKRFGQLSEDVLAGGGNMNGARAVGAFSQGVIGKLDESDLVFRAFANASTTAELARLASELTPDVNGGSNTAAMNGQSLVNNAIGTRTASGRGMSGGAFVKETGIWVRALTSKADQSERHGVTGYDADSKGIAVGADGKLNDRTTVGAAWSYLTTDVDGDAGDKTDVRGHSLSLYGSYELDKWFLDGSLTYGKNGNESKRSVAGTIAKADYDSELLGLNARAGYTYQLNPTMVLEPQVGARYTNIETDSYSENGSSAALRVNAQRFEIGEVGFGARLAGAELLGKGVLKPEATVMFWHDVIGDSATSTNSFLLGGNAFTTNGATADRNGIESSLGLKYSVGQWTVGASYDQLIKTDFSAKSYGLNARYDF